MKKIGIVVLNYKNYEDTLMCVDSLIRQENVQMNIVIVENGSNNESFEVIKNKFENVEYITLIESKKNLGYSKGNNLGIEYLRSIGIEYVLVLNSDTILHDNNVLCELIQNDEEDVGVVNPLVRNLDGSIEQRVAYLRKYFLLRVCKNLVKAIIKRKNSNKAKNDDYNENNKQIIGKQHDRYILTGSAYMLTPSFFCYYKRLFPKTFLYCEETATLIYVHKAKLKTKIAEKAVVIHKGEASTPNSEKEGSVIKQKHIKNSAKKVIKLTLMTCRRIINKYNV